ncbi:MAG TPA: type III-B CRISPR-associated protein Cas10/Cmr2 [Thermoanaerobaculia bacterium]|nr:type III-B CRISPR-associated protein Cas10/Cmr2 [Thermoanaerobaculia bacterium]
MPSVLAIALGPIQDFIASARRCRDLWFGSWLLSELAKAAALEVDSGGAELIFPGTDRDELRAGSETAVGNKIVARVPDGTSPGDLAERGREAVGRRLAVIRDEAFDRIVDTLPDGPYFLRDMARLQVEDLIEYVWSSAQETAAGYRAARDDAERLLAARKHTRLWPPVAWGAPVPKSSLDGARESVLREELFDGIHAGRFGAEEVRRRYQVGSAERLCGVGLLKRHGRRDGSRFSHHFLSTGHLAAWPLLERLEGIPSAGELRALWERLIGALRAGGVDLDDLLVYADPDHSHSLVGRYDGGLLFESRLPDLFPEIPDPAARRARVEPARRALAAFLSAVGVGHPVPYYAVLMADGDLMGKAIDRQPGFAEHRALSAALAGFARRARQLVEGAHRGELIYAGGDDVLAFVPLHRAVACARELAGEFCSRLAAFPVAAGGAAPTLSVGVGVSHFLDPMSDALALARKAERQAKATRNALAVLVDKRSGPPLAVTGTWGRLDVHLDQLVALHVGDRVPDGAAYELQALARLLDGAAGDQRTTLQELVRKEAERILRRKQPGHGAASGLEAKVMPSLLKALDELGVEVLAERLIVARLLAAALGEATPPAAAFGAVALGAAE